jgi:hypothetical protein
MAYVDTDSKLSSACLSSQGEARVRVPREAQGCLIRGALLISGMPYSYQGDALLICFCHAILYNSYALASPWRTQSMPLLTQTLLCISIYKTSLVHSCRPVT